MSRDGYSELLAGAEVGAPAGDRRVPGSSLADGSFWGNLTISLHTHTGNRTRAALAKIDARPLDHQLNLLDFCPKIFTKFT